MMNYEVFKEVVAEEILGYMPDDFANHKVEISSVKKVNRIEDSLQLIPPEGRGEQAIPSLSINHLYEDYKQYEDLKDTLTFGAYEFAKAYEMAPQNVEKKIMENAKDKVVMMLINTEQNRELLQTVPHRDFHDLSIVYRIVADIDANGIQSAMIGHELAERLEMDEQTLYMVATQNTKRLFPPVIKSMNDVLKEIFITDGMSEEIADKMFGEMPADKIMYVITNERGTNGAVSMLYEGELHSLAEQLGSDLYILPSSLHEVIAVSADMGDPYELAQMVAEINMGQVDLADRLSNQVYHYDKDLRRLTMATDTPNKRLDGIVAEPPMFYETKQSR